MKLVLSFTVVLVLLSTSVWSLNLGYQFDSENYIILSNKVQDEWLPANREMQVDEYESVSTFWIELGEDESYNSPKVKVLEGNGLIEPTLDGDAMWDPELFYTEEYDEFWIELQVNYGCRKQGKTALQVTIPLINKKTDQITDLTFAWEKLCGQGTRYGFNVGTTEGGSDVVEDGETTPVWTGDVTISPTVSYTTFYLSMDEAFGSQTYLPPKAVSSNPVVLVHSRGYASIANVISDTEYPQELTIVYECLGVGSSIISITLEILPFEPIVWQWVKSCGGEVHHGLNIGLTPGGTEVLNEGQNVASFSQWKSPPDARKTDFYLQIGSDGENQVVQPSSILDRFGWGSPQGSRGDSQIVEAVLVTSSVGGVMKGLVEINDGPASPVIVSSESPTKMSVFYGCMRKHKDVVVTVSMLVPNHKMVEFSWKKDCVRLSPKVDKSVWTANQILGLIFFIILIIGAVSFYLYKKYGPKKLARF